MESSPLRIRTSSGRDINILCDSANDKPPSSRTISGPYNVRSALPERPRMCLPVPALEPFNTSALAIRQREPFRLPPLALRRRKTHWDLKARDDGVSQYAHYPFPPPDSSRPLSAATMGALGRSYYTSQEESRHSYQGGLMMRLCHGHRPPMLPTPGLFRSGSRTSINIVDLDSPSTPRGPPPNFAYPPPPNATFSSVHDAPTIYPDLTQFENGARPLQFDSHSKDPLTPVLRFPTALPTPHHAAQYHDPAPDAFNASQCHTEPQPLGVAPPPVRTVTSTGSKHYHCRYAHIIGCDKTFTTSGHASRHSKIHTCHKGLQCAFPGCPKKFTRTDNMKQHLETHYRKTTRLRASLTHGAAVRRNRRKTALTSTVVLRRENPGLTCKIPRLAPRQEQAAARWPGSEGEGRIEAVTAMMGRDHGESSTMGAVRPRLSGSMGEGLDALADAVAEKVAEDDDKAGSCLGRVGS
ncbi:transcriptional repressor [Pseudogymnoascus australis]